MKVPTCPIHGNLVLDLARGRLSDVDAVAADEARESCRHCAQWWDITFTESATAQVDAAVGQAYAAFSPPTSRRRSWFAAAAAVVLAVGVGTTTLLWRGGENPPSVAVQAPNPGAVLSAWDFEDGELLPNAIEAQIEPTPSDPFDTDAAVFVSDLESGDLGSWTLHS